LAGVKPSFATETRIVFVVHVTVTPPHVSLQNTSCVPLRKTPGARFVAVEVHAKYRPLESIDGCELAPFA
jgi:hypothetical protein